MRNVWIVFDLGFGDAGKGATVDFLVRDAGADLVVRHHGGAQAGHNVVTPDGRHHTFSQFGSGTFVPGVRTLLGPRFVLHPGAMRFEADRLRQNGVADALARTSLDGRALVITPFQQAAGRLRELDRGARSHGTCGIGFGESVKDALEGCTDVLRASDLTDVDLLVARLDSQRRRKREEFAHSRTNDPRAEPERNLLNNPESIERTLSLWRPLADQLRILPQEETQRLLRDSRATIFEGAQGILLDQDRGFHPHTTWSDCTPAGALELLRDVDARITRIGVLRTYMVRHGAGPMPTHDPEFDRTLPELHNADAGWQGRFRRGPLDLVLLRYALSASGGAEGLAVTCLDRTGDTVSLCRTYEDGDAEEDRLDEPPPGDHAALQWFGQSVARFRPRIEAVSREDLGRILKQTLGVRVDLLADGPSAAHRRRVPTDT